MPIIAKGNTEGKNITVRGKKKFYICTQRAKITELYMLFLKIYSGRDIKTCFRAQNSTSLINNMMKLNVWGLIFLPKYLKLPPVKNHRSKELK